jgi:MinD-like ATPase involved in chromosome partitioning or flagellar assembly
MKVFIINLKQGKKKEGIDFMDEEEEETEKVWENKFEFVELIENKSIEQTNKLLINEQRKKIEKYILKLNKNP